MMISSLLSLLQTLILFMLVFCVQLLLILALRKPVRRWLGARTAYLLWLLPVVCLPFFFTANALNKWVRSALAGITQPEISVGAAATQATTSGLTESALNFSAQVYDTLLLPVSQGTIFTDGSARIFWLGLTVLWLAGMLLLFIWQAARMIRFNQMLKSHGRESPLPRELEYRVSCITLRAMDGPAVFGFFKPVLLLPEHFEQVFDADQRHLVLAHEAVHLRRRDNLWNLLADAFRLLFWVNPLVHIAYRLYRLDQELSCDAAALELCTPTQQHRFARTLLKTTEPDRFHPPFALTSWDDLDELKERSMMIKQHLKHKRRPGITSLLLSLLILTGATGTTVIANNQIDVVTPDGTLSTEVAELIQQIEDTLNISGSVTPKGETVPIAREALTTMHEMADSGLLNQYEKYQLWYWDAQVTLEERSTMGLWFSSSLLTPLNTVPTNDQTEYLELSITAAESYIKALEFTADDSQRIPLLYRLSQLYMSGPMENEETRLEILLNIYALHPEYKDVAENISLIYSSNDQLQEALPFAEEAVANARIMASEVDFSDENIETDNLSNRMNVMSSFLGLSSLYYRMGYEDDAQEVLDELEKLVGGYDTEFMEL